MNTTTLKISLRKLKILLPIFNLLVPTHDSWKEGKKTVIQQFLIQMLTSRANEIGLSDGSLNQTEKLSKRKRELTPCMLDSERTQTAVVLFLSHALSLSGMEPNVSWFLQMLFA